MFDDLPCPFMIGNIKIWPAHSRPGMRWFIAYESKPYWFKSLNEAKLFAMDKSSIEDPEGLCD
jgi:hypothetical protein